MIVFEYVPVWYLYEVHEFLHLYVVVCECQWECLKGEERASQRLTRLVSFQQ